MCLYIKDRKPLIAKEDIKVKKYLRLFEGKYISPYYRQVVPEDGIMIPEESLPQIYPKIYSSFGRYELTSGVIHSFKPSRFVFGEWSKEGFIFDAIIPKGTAYYEGTDNYGNKSYASRVLHVKFKKERKLTCAYLLNQVSEWLQKIFQS